MVSMSPPRGKHGSSRSNVFSNNKLRHSEVHVVCLKFYSRFFILTVNVLYGPQKTFPTWKHFVMEWLSFLNLRQWLLWGLYLLRRGKRNKRGESQKQAIDWE